MCSGLWGVAERVLLWKTKKGRQKRKTPTAAWRGVKPHHLSAEQLPQSSGPARGGSEIFVGGGLERLSVSGPSFSQNLLSSGAVIFSPHPRHVALPWQPPSVLKGASRENLARAGTT